MAKLECKILNIIKFKKISWLILALSFWLPQLWAADRTEPADKSSSAAPSSWRLTSVIAAVKERLFGAPITTDKPPAPTPKQPVPAPLQLTTIVTSPFIPILSQLLTSPPHLEPNIVPISPISFHKIFAAESDTIKRIEAKKTTGMRARRATSAPRSFGTYRMPKPGSAFKFIQQEQSIHDILMQHANSEILEEFFAHIKQTTRSELLSTRLTAALLQRDDLENTPLHTAILMASPELVTIIQRETRALGIDLRNCKNVNKYTPADFLSDAHRTYTEPEIDIYDPVTQKPTTITRYWSTTYSNYVHAGKISSEKYDQLRQALYTHSKDLAEPILPVSATNPIITPNMPQPNLIQKPTRENTIAASAKAVTKNQTQARSAVIITKLLKKNLVKAHENFTKNQQYLTPERSLESRLQAVRFIKAQREAAELKQKLTKIPKLLDRIAAFGYYPKKTISSPTRATSELFKPIISSENGARLANEYDRLEKLRTID